MRKKCNVHFAGALNLPEKITENLFQFEVPVDAYVVSKVAAATGHLLRSAAAARWSLDPRSGSPCISPGKSLLLCRRKSLLLCRMSIVKQQAKDPGNSPLKSRWTPVKVVTSCIADDASCINMSPKLMSFGEGFILIHKNLKLWRVKIYCKGVLTLVSGD